MRLNSVQQRKANNFDLMRIIFAWFVIVTHAYILTGSKNCDPICEFTNHYINLSYVGVKGFFVISGYLIFQSLLRCHSVPDYLLRRILRIYPALIAVLLVTVCCIYFIYPHNNQPSVFFVNATHYVTNNLLLFTNQWSMKGIFDHLPLSVINGSLWTIGFEFFFYLVTIIFYSFRKNNTWLRVVLIGLIVMCTLGNLYLLPFLSQLHFILKMNLLVELGSYFFIGSLFASFAWDKIPSKKPIFFLAIFLLLAAVYSKADLSLTVFPLAYIILFLGKKENKFASLIHEYLGDPSYGIYLYAFPLQQFLIYFFKPSITILLWTSSAGALILGILSWYLIEKRALKYKSLLVVRPH